MEGVCMSHIGRKSIRIPDNLIITQNDGGILFQKGSVIKSLQIPAEISVNLNEDLLSFGLNSMSKEARSLYGLYRSLANNIIIGLTQGFSCKLELVGVGLRASVENGFLKMRLGFSHEVSYPLPSDVNIRCVTPTQVLINGTDKQRVYQVAANIRDFKRPDGYKGKGIRYSNEILRLKEGKRK
jgi:large subunit ribosomal protein L6